ncbi:MAG: SDR family oxidoreductase [Lentisphaeria bacterium]|nr:SDR family oxidoreductase [Lentisphaeria bacterium]
MSNRLKDQIAIITGAAGGIGKDMAMCLAAEGAHVVMADVQEGVMNAAAELIEKFPDNKGYGVTVDITKGDDVSTMVAEVVDNLGRLDLLVNNAGVNHPMTPVAEITDETFDWVVGVNMRGTFNGCRAAAPVMTRQKSGCIVNLGSWYGKQGFANFSVYCSSKAAVIRMTECVALELAPAGVRVNSVCPGNVATDMHWNALKEEAVIRGTTFEEMDKMVKEGIPLGYQCPPEDIANAVIYLASDDGKYMTGQALNVNGGCLFH